MPPVAIVPAYSKQNRDAKQHWRDTIEQLVPFAEPRYAAKLTPPQLADRRHMHPSGAARFWGATYKQDKKFQGLTTGDIAVFTAESAVRGVGEIGVLFENQEFGDRLWTPHRDIGSWRNVFSLRTFEFAEIPVSEIYALPEFATHPPFQGLWPLPDERAASILEFPASQGLASAHFGSGLPVGLASAAPRGQLKWTREEVILAMDFYVRAGCLKGAPIPGLATAGYASRTPWGSPGST